MCLFCDGYTPDQVHRALDLRILTDGFALQGVDGPRPWVYTVGLLENFSHPELIITDVRLDRSQPVLRALGDAVVDGGPDAFADLLALGGFTTRAVHPAHFDTSLLNIWSWFYDAPPAAGTWLQVVPPPDWFCTQHRAESARLDEPTPWIGVTMVDDDPPPRRRPPNRAERRAQMKRRRW